MGMSGRVRMGLLAALVAAGAMPAAAQYSDRFTFLKAVRENDGAKAMEILKKPGSPDLNSRDPSTGETALHIVVRRHDPTWLGFLLARGANPQLRDNGGDTPLLAATKLSDAAAVQTLLEYRGGVNATDNQGQTPLIVAVQHRDLPILRLLLGNGADVGLADRIAGKTAKDYAADDPRGGPVMKLLETAKPQPVRQVSGPVRK